MQTINAEPAWTEEAADDGVNVFAVHGELTRAVAERLARRVLALASSGEHAFVVDLAAVGAMDARAMIPLLRAARVVHPDGGRVSVVFDPLLQVFAVDGLDALFDVAVTREEAVAGIAQGTSAEAHEQSS